VVVKVPEVEQEEAMVRESMKLLMKLEEAVLQVQSESITSTCLKILKAM